MTIAWASFTPISAFLGGCLIGLPALLLMVFQGRVMGVSGIIGGLFGTASPAECGWRLAFVMGGGVLVNAIGHRCVMKRKSPIQCATFSIPTSTNINKPLVIGSVIFGFGWELAGLCPGPVVASLRLNGQAMLPFFGLMIAGLLVGRIVMRRLA